MFKRTIFSIKYNDETKRQSAISFMKINFIKKIMILLTVESI